MEISKDLLSEVLKLHILKYSCNGYNLYYDYFKDGVVYTSYNTTVGEVAFKCKEWLYYQIKEIIISYYAPVTPSQYNIDINSGHSPNVRIKYNNILNKNIKGDYYCRVSEPDNSGQYRTFIAETEVEAIFLACEYIREYILNNIKH